MQSKLRFLLSWLVVVAHLTEGTAPWVAHFGVFAVFGFYLLSGYLMTLVLVETYDFRFAPYAANRFLRLFPVYFLIAGLSLLLITALPDAPSFKKQ